MERQKLDLKNNDYDYERQYATTAAEHYSSWQAYAAGRFLAERFRQDGELAELQRLYEYWREVNAAPVTTSGSN